MANDVDNDSESGSNSCTRIRTAHWGASGLSTERQACMHAERTVLGQHPALEKQATCLLPEKELGQ